MGLEGYFDSPNGDKSCDLGARKIDKAQPIPKNLLSAFPQWRVGVARDSCLISVASQHGLTAGPSWSCGK